MSSDINVQTFSGKVNINNNLLVGSSHLFVDTVNNRVGITTADPDAGLHVNSNAYVHTDFRVGSGIVMNDTTGQITAGSFVGDGSGLDGINSDSGSWVNGTGNVYLSTIGDKVGIGHTNPLGKLYIAADYDHTLQRPSSSSNHYLVLSKTGAQVVDEGPGISFCGSYHSTSDFQDVMAEIRGICDTDGGRRGRLEFWTSSSDGINDVDTQAMTIKSDGNVGIGTTNPSSVFNTYGGSLWDGTDHTSKVCATLQVGRGSGSGAPTRDSGTGAILEFRHHSDQRFVTIESVSEGNYSADIGIRFKTTDDGTGPQERVRIDAHGNVGIGATTPGAKLHVNGSIKSGTAMNGSNSHVAALDVRGNGTGSEQQPVAIVNSYAESDTIIFCDRNPYVTFAIAHENSSNDFLITGGGSTNDISNYKVRAFDGTQQTAYVKHRFDVDNAHLEIGGLLKAGLGNGGDLINFGTKSGQAAVYMVSANSTNDWDNYPGFYSPGEAEMRWHGNPDDLNIRSDGWVYGHDGFAPFTGIHTCNSYFDEDKIGLIVCSNGDYCTDDKRYKAWFNDIKIMNTSPLINLCTKEKDKSVFGVVGKIQNTYKKIEFIRKLDYECLPPDQKELYEPLVTGYKHRKTQDEITIEEYDALENKKYFKPIFEQAKAINYDGSTKFQVTHVNSLGEGGIWVINKSGNFENGDYITSSSVPGYGQKQDDDLLHNYTVAKITTDCGFTKITYTRRYIEQIEGIHQYDENNEPIYINEIDEDGNVIRDLKFKLRYLLPDGTQISEEEYTTRALADERVFIAAFVGCTYHCG